MEKREEEKRDFGGKILPAPLTAGKSTQIWAEDKKLGLKYSIDRITLIADLSVEIWEKRFFEWLRLPFIEISGGGLQVLDYSNCDVDDFGNKHEHVSPEQVAYIEMPKYQVNKIRIDFNPNHSMNSEGGLWLRNLLSKLPQKHFSRADIAIDILNAPEIEYYQVWKFGCSETIYMNRKREMETIYWGKASSQQQIRLYNKKVEQEKRHGKIVNLNAWWRLEMQLRGDKVEEYPRLVAEMLEDFYRADYESNKLTRSEQDKLAHLILNPMYYGHLPRTSQQRLREIIRKSKPENGLSYEIAKGFKDALPMLEKELYTYKGQFHIN